MADFYVPLYRANSNGIPFTASPYNDTNPPAVIVGMATDTLLLPAPNYPFDAHIPVLRGLVTDAANKSVPDVYVTQGNLERVLNGFARDVCTAAALGSIECSDFYRCNGSADQSEIVTGRSKFSSPFAETKSDDHNQLRGLRQCPNI